MERDGSEAVIRMIESVDGPERTQLYHFARGAFALREWDNKRLDPIIDVCQAGIEHMTRASELEDANVMAYNLAADLAPCWPGDDLPRDPHHFEAGLNAADQCVSWRAELGKGPAGLALAHWARGIHLMARPNEADQAMTTALDCAVADAEANGKIGVVSADAPDIVILSAGYCGLAARLAGRSSDNDLYAQADKAFEAKLKLKRSKADEEHIAFHLAQLAKTNELLVEKS